jgi:hypothetical protein
MLRDLNREVSCKKILTGRMRGKREVSKEMRSKVILTRVTERKRRY